MIYISRHVPPGAAGQPSSSRGQTAAEGERDEEEGTRGAVRDMGGGKEEGGYGYVHIKHGCRKRGREGWTEGGRSEKETKGSGRFPQGILHISTSYSGRLPILILIQRTAAGNTDRGMREETVRFAASSVGGENKAVSTAVSEIYFDLTEGRANDGQSRSCCAIPLNAAQEMRWGDGAGVETLEKL